MLWLKITEQDDSRQQDFNVGMIKVDRLQVVPGRAGGGSFRRKKNYIAKKEFAYRMCDRPARCPNHFFAVNEPSAVHGGDVTCFDACHAI